MKDWKDLFDIVRKDSHPPGEDEWAMMVVEWHLVNKETKQVCGKYRDYHYAKKQAKRKFQKIVRAVEKLLLGQQSDRTKSL